MTVLEELRAVNAYPIPMREIVSAADRRGIGDLLTGESTPEIVQGREFRLAQADLLLWLAVAPDISQGGQSYSFTDEQRRQMRLRARAVMDELGDGEADPGTAYGYKGDRL